MAGRPAVTREQALGFRLARHHLRARVGADRVADAAAAGLQDTPPGTAAIALAARADAGPAALGELVLVPSLRGAPLAVAPADLALFTAGLAPPDEAAARVLIGNAAKTLDGMPALDALDRVAEAVRDALRAGPLPRDAFHQALRERLPDTLLPWCAGCGSHHVHPSLWRATGVRGVLAIVGREGRTAVFGAPPAAPPVDDPGAALARRFLRLHGPATPALLAGWTGTAPAHAKALWARAGDLAEVDLGGARRWVLAEDLDALLAAGPGTAVRLLPGLDPLHGARDRDLLVPDPALRKRTWPAISGPGTVLAGARLAGLWRAARRGRGTVVTVEALGRPPARAALEAEAERVAAARGTPLSAVDVRT